MDKYKKIYVMSPHGTSTGGVELCHQLVDYLRNRNYDAYIVYVKDWKISNDQSITQTYQFYNIKSTQHIEDTPNNILVLPEIFFDYILQFKNIQIGCWWMSVDNHYKCTTFKDCFLFEKSWINKMRLLKQYMVGQRHQFKNSLKLLHKEEKRIIHFYQSHYAQFHLYNLGMPKIMPLSDYINIQIENNINHNIKKEDIILFNPKKGFDFTKKVIKRIHKFKFIPLQGFNRKELSDIFDRAKLYIDFGNFPGKDRLPREAAAHNCCIITGKNGASYFYEDLPLKETYKFETKTKNLKIICERIKDVMENYDERIKDFTYYCNLIYRERELFHAEINDIFIQ